MKFMNITKTLYLNSGHFNKLASHSLLKHSCRHNCSWSILTKPQKSLPFPHVCLSKSKLPNPYQKSSQIRCFSVSSTWSSNNEVEPKRRKKSDSMRLLMLAEPEKYKISCALGFLVLSSSITMAVPFAIGHIIDIIYSTDASVMQENLKNVCLALTGVFITGGLSNSMRVYLMNIAGQRITRSLRSKVYSSIVRQENAFFDKNKTGELVNRLSSDTLVVSQAITMNISDGIRSIVTIFAGVGMMCYMSVNLAMVGLSIIPPVVGLAVIYGKTIRKISKQVQDKLAEATQVADERISSIRTVKSFAQEAKEIMRYNGSIDEVLQMTRTESLAKAAFFGVAGFSGNMVVLSVLYSGGMMVTDSQISVGSLTSFLLYAAYVGISLSSASSFVSEMNKGLGASSRLFDLIDRKPLIPFEGGRVLPMETVRGEILFQNLVFQYPTRPTHKILNHFNLDVPAGSVVALVGASGSGKSTIGSLLQRFYDPLEGSIYLDGTPINELDPTWLRSLIGSVSQEPTLFSTTILENLLYGVEKPESFPIEKVRWACTQANALSFIEEFPDKFATVVGERGIMLSGGQKQRIAIARALLTDPKVLLLDEATSALDATSEGLVQEALDRLMVNRTVITIAHRLSTIRNAHKIAVIRDGVVAEHGTYDQLIERPNGVFRKLVEKQTIKS